MRVTLVQFESGNNPQQNVATIERMLEGTESDLVVLPEASMHRFGSKSSSLGRVAQGLDGQFVTDIADLARRHSATFVAGMFETSSDPDRPFNTVIAVDPDGELITTYRKAHLYDAYGYQESALLSIGEPIPRVVPVGPFTCGLLTCYDIRFPEYARALVDAGADVLIVPAAWVRGSLKEDHWRTLLRARAIENTVYVVAAAQNGSRYCGLSMVVAPDGVVVASAGADEETLSENLDPDRVARVREQNPSLQHRRSWE